MFTQIGVVFLLGIAGAHFASPGRFSSCYQGDSDCPSCPEGRTMNFTSTIYLSLNSTHSEIADNVQKAQKIIEQFGNGSDIIEMRPLLLLHTTLNYFCCHTPEETGEILAILQSYHWSPMSLTYDNVSCNLDHNNNTIYLLATPNAVAQDYLFHWVRGVEAEMRRRGIPVNNPRKQPFHCTMALVDHHYPVDAVLRVLGTGIPYFATIKFEKLCVEMPFLCFGPN